jgi:hypothetical protein
LLLLLLQLRGGQSHRRSSCEATVLIKVMISRGEENGRAAYDHQTFAGK